MPNCEEEWLEISDQFQRRWNFDHCIGAIDGKHIEIDAPPNSGSMYYNYKGYFSIVLLAVVDADYRFIYISVGSTGKQSDGGVFANSQLNRALENNLLSIPKPAPLGSTKDYVPFVFVADDAFPLTTYMLKPYPGIALDKKQCIFNYRLSRARRIVENAFGIMAQRFRVLRKPMNLNLDKAYKVVLATCVLHNFLRNCTDCIPSVPFEYQDSFTSPEVSDVDAGDIRDDARVVRDKFKEFFSNEGRLPWQDDIVNRK